MSYDFKTITPRATIPSTGVFYGSDDPSTTAPAPYSRAALPAFAGGAFETRTAAAAATISTGINVIHTDGYATAGDGGDATYIKAAGSTSGGFQSADSQWWQIHDPILRPEMFGAKGDDSTDDTAAINAAVQLAISRYLANNNAENSEIYLCPKIRYKTSSPINIFSYNSGPKTFNFIGLTIRGSGKNSVEGTIKFTGLTTPAIIYQAVRSLKLIDFSIVGSATTTFPSRLQSLDDGTSPWWNTGGATDARYSPHCGICQDPFGSSLPADGGYPGYNGTGGTNYYTQVNGSHSVTIENVGIYGFIVGIGLSLTSGAQLGDDVSINNCDIGTGKIGIAIGGSQTRGVFVKELNAGPLRCVIDTSNYGDQSGPSPFCFGGIWTYCRTLFDMTSGGWTGSGTIQGVYSEGLWSVGAWSSNYALTIKDCDFNLNDPVSNATPAADFHLYAGGLATFGPVVLSGGYIGYGLNTKRLIYADGSVFVDNCQFDVDLPIFEFPVLARIIQSQRTTDNGVTTVFSYSLIDRLTTNGEYIDTSSFGVTARYRNLSNWVDVSLGNNQLNTSSNGTATVTISSNVAALAVGDAILGGFQSSTQPFPTLTRAILGIVATVNYSTGAVTLNSVPLTAVKATPGTSYNMYTRRLPWAKARCLGTTTIGTNTVTLTGANGFGAGADGTYFRDGSTANIWNTGDHIACAGIPANTVVTAGGAASITISQNASASGTYVLYDAVLRVHGYATSVPTSGVWAVGDYFEKLTPSAPDGNGEILVGWLCTTDGIPGTWQTIYAKTTSP